MKLNLTQEEVDTLFSEKTMAFAGDWHGNTAWALKIIDMVASRNVKIIYQLGDFGLWGGSSGSKYLLKVEKKLATNNMLLVVTPGNHENYDILAKMPVNQYGFQTRNDIQHIWFAPRGHVWKQNILTIASIGGAGSIDLKQRIDGESWWREEEITEEDIEVFRKNIKNKINVLLTHDCPVGVDMHEDNKDVPPEVVHYCHSQRILLRDALDWSSPEKLLHGHWHCFSKAKIEGMNYQNEKYSTFVTGLSLDGTHGNLLIAAVNESGQLEDKEIF